MVLACIKRSVVQTKNSELDPDMHGGLVYDRGGISSQCEKD